MGIHSRCVPAGGAQLLCHFAHHLAPLLSQLMAPGAGDDHFNRITDGAAAREVVVDGGRAVGVNILDLADRGDSRGLIAGEGNHVCHFIYRKLIQQLFPLRVIVGLAAKIHKLQAVLGAEGRHGVVRIDVGVRVIVCVKVISLNVLFRHIQIHRCCSSSVVVCKVVGTGEIFAHAAGILQNIDCRNVIRGARVILIIGYRLADRVDTAVQFSVGIGLDGNDVISCLQDVAAYAQIIIGSEVFLLEGNGHGLALARLDHAGLLVADQVGTGLFNSAVCIGRVEVDLHHVLAGSVACVGDGDVKTERCSLFPNVGHLLGKGGVAQAVAEGILDDAVIVKGEGRLCGGNRLCLFLTLCCF